MLAREAASWLASAARKGGAQRYRVADIGDGGSIGLLICAKAARPLCHLMSGCNGEAHRVDARGARAIFLI